MDMSGPLAIASMPHMWITFGVIVVALIAFSRDSIPLELTSLVILVMLLLLFYLSPLKAPDGTVLLQPVDLLLGFANPALVAVMCLLILGQAVVRTGSLNEIANLILKLSRNNTLIAVTLTLVVVMVVSAVLNNTPVVVIFIPILAAFAKQLGRSVSSMMMPLSFAAILGGMTTLIGSSTNLLVSGELEKLSGMSIGFFDFLLPGSVLALVGLVYIVMVAPRILPDRASMVKDLMGEDVRKFIAQLELDHHSNLVGRLVSEDHLKEMPDINLRMIQRGEHAYLPPFDEGMSLKPGDTLVVAATRKALTELLSDEPKALLHKFPEFTEGSSEEDDLKPASGVSIAEVVVAPASRMIGLNLEQIGFRYHYHAIVLGIQRGERIIRKRVTEIRLAAGDVLLVMGQREDVMKLRETRDMMLMEWSAEDLPSKQYARLANSIFFTVVGVAALDVLPIYISALAGAAAIIASGCLSIRQAFRTLDSQIIFMVASALALASAMEATGGAAFIAHLLITAMEGVPPVMVMSALFLVMAAFTNMLSNNASALLFTPIAYSAALQLNADPLMFIYAVIFACNCSFATPIGYQTNLLVMGPGHYKFVDFMRAGIPLMFVMWATYTLYTYYMF